METVIVYGTMASEGPDKCITYLLCHIIIIMLFTIISFTYPLSVWLYKPRLYFTEDGCTDEISPLPRLRRNIATPLPLRHHSANFGSHSSSELFKIEASHPHKIQPDNHLIGATSPDCQQVDQVLIPAALLKYHENIEIPRHSLHVR